MSEYYYDIITVIYYRFSHFSVFLSIIRKDKEGYIKRIPELINYYFFEGYVHQGTIAFI